MRKLRFLIMLLACLTFAACSDDDEPENKITAENVVPGTYTGYTKVDCAYFQDDYADNQTLKIEAAANNTFNVSYTSENYGEYSVTGVTAMKSGDKFILSGEGVTKMGMNGNIKEYPCTFTGEVDADKAAPQFKFTMPSVMGGLTVLFKTGTMPEK